VPWVLKQKKEKKKNVRQQKGEGVGGGDGGDGEGREKGEEGSGDKTFLRYYHLYRKGELERDIVEAGGTVVESGYEKDNWWAIASHG
jgi:tRNA (uracil-5-)-methyltransferase TRM9